MDTATISELLVPGKRFTVVRHCISELVAGRVVLLCNGFDTAALIAAADRVSSTTMAFIIRHTTGYVCVGMTEPDCERLNLPPMTGSIEGSVRGYRVSVDALSGIGTGISAHDRAHTARLLANPSTTAAMLTRPGHLVPMQVARHGVLQYRGEGEAAVDLARLSGGYPAAVFCTLITDHPEGGVADREHAERFAAGHGLAMLDMAELIEYRRCHDQSAQLRGAAEISVESVPFTVHTFDVGTQEVLAATLTDPNRRDHNNDVLVRTHRECLASQLFGDQACQCRSAVDESVARIRAAGTGILLMLRADRDRDHVASPCPNWHGGTARELNPFEESVAAKVLAELKVSSVHVPAMTPPWRRAEERDSILPNSNDKRRC